MNPVLQTASEYSNLVEKLNQFRKYADFSQIDLLRLKKKADDIKNNVDVAKGFALSGMIACLENDAEAMKSYFKRAAEQSGVRKFL